MPVPYYDCAKSVLSPLYKFIDFAGEAHLDDRGHDLIEGVQKAYGSVVSSFVVPPLEDRGHVGQHNVVWNVLLDPAQA